MQARRWALSLATGLALPACGPPTIVEPAATDLQIAGGPLELFSADQVTLRVTFSGGLGGSVTWESTDPSVVSVTSDGTVTAHGAGNAEVIALSGTLRDTLAATVLDPLGGIWPLDAVVNQDAFYTNYVDRDRSAGVQDYSCGPRSYDGHRGVDIAIRSFTVMDSGVTVVASAPGTVIETRDGMADRNTVWAGGGFGNYVAIQHRDDIISYYGHMVRNSIAVSMGQTVAAGTPLGLVGSSGQSDGAHLHYELQRRGETLDPYAGACGSPVTHWAQALPYQSTLRLIDAGVVAAEPTLDAAKEGLPDLDTLQAAARVAAMWVQLHNLKHLATSRWVLTRPDGSTFGDFTYMHSTFFTMSWWWSFFSLPGGFPQLGTWQWEFYHDGQLLATQPFVVVASPAAPGRTGALRPMVGGGGGGLGPGRMVTR